MIEDAPEIYQNKAYNQQLIAHLEEFITPKRRDTLLRVLANRTRYLSVVLEDLYQPQNASAVLRTADCLGVQDVHIIENKHIFRVSSDVEKGASSWLNMHYYNRQQNNTLEAIQNLKAQGYRIVATTPHTDDVDLHHFDINKGKVALVFGTELTGISDVVRAEADEFLRIPMYGFTESYNISVSAAITLQHLRYRMEQEQVAWQLNQETADNIMINWLKHTIKASEDIVNRFNENWKNS